MTMRSQQVATVQGNRGCGLGLGGALGERALPKLRPGGGRKVPPTNVKDLLPRPCGAKRKLVYPIPPSGASGDFGVLKFCGSGSPGGLALPGCGFARSGTCDLRRTTYADDITTFRLALVACRHVACRSRKSSVVSRMSKLNRVTNDYDPGAAGTGETPVIPVCAAKMAALPARRPAVTLR